MRENREFLCMYFLGNFTHPTVLKVSNFILRSWLVSYVLCFVVREIYDFITRENQMLIFILIFLK